MSQAAQLSEEVEPTFPLKLPDGQLKQLVALTPELQKPEAQLVQALAPSPEKLPSAQLEQLV